MRIGRTLPPTAAPIYFRDIISGLRGVFQGRRELERFKVELREYFGVKHCFLVSSGKAALTLILQALKELYPDRDEVLIPAFTCYSVPSSIVRAGLKVRLCDINPDTLDFDFDQLCNILSQCSHGEAYKNTNELSDNNYELPSLSPQPATSTQPYLNHSDPSAKRSSSEAVLPPYVVSNRLLAIVPTHLFGLPADIDRVRELLGDPQIVIVEDAAQAMGGEWKGKKLGTLGDVSFFSLGRGKALSAVEGGIILTDRADIAEKIEGVLGGILRYSIKDLIRLAFNAVLLAVFLKPRFFWFPKSLPFLKLGETIYDPSFKIRRMSYFQAGLAKGWQKKLKEFKEKRAKNSRRWASFLQEDCMYRYRLENGNLPDLIRFPIRVDNESLRERILRGSEQQGLGIMPAYPDSIDGIQELKDGFQGQRLPISKKTVRKIITLPVHPFITERDVDEIAGLTSKIGN